ncbi:putative olfactory ionotropic receptor IR7-like 1 [Homarus americanus]|nr:putative olfactory ionotropic receptor IR7-like 1 [Homarus americanus]
MLMTLVLTRSYSGNLMSLLAVRHIPEPYQTLEDVVKDPSVTMIWKTKTIYVTHFRTSTSGIFREVGALEQKGRVIHRVAADIRDAFDTLVRRGDHVLLDVENSIFNRMTQDFSQTGRCDFYKTKAKYFRFMYAMVGQKDSLLIPAVSQR